MRKLLILTLVLGMASLAMATPTITVSNATPANGDTIQVYITGIAADASPDGVGGVSWSGFLALDYATLGTTGASPYLSVTSFSPAATTAAGAYGTAAKTGGTPGVGFFAAAGGAVWSELNDVDAGLWFTYDVLVTGVDGDSEVIDILDNTLVQTGESVTINIIPEPMTMALLGLGGLFLRRRK